MDGRHERAGQTHQRLLQVLARADVHFFAGTFCHEEFPARDFPQRARSDAVALVRDAQRWSQLIPSAGGAHDRWTLFSFHFATDLDGSGFVGWLASHLRERLGTRVLVVCGQNSERGGIFDYWCCPADVGEDVIAEIQRLRSQGGAVGDAAPA